MKSTSVNIKELKQAFDKALLTHEMGEDGFGGKTTVILVKGEMAFGGCAICHSGDQFSRVRGRTIAIGRALHAFEVVTKGKAARKRQDYNSFYGKVEFLPEQKISISEEKKV